jgi:hypothetical protein
MSSPSSGDTLCLHFPCFDGLISGVLAAKFLEAQGWSFSRVEPLNYKLRSTWLESPLLARTAVVDFLFHPAAKFWADHHVTTFLSEQARQQFEETQSKNGDCPRWFFYDSRQSSCAMLLWQRLGHDFGSEAGRLREMVIWADKIDSASYESVEEAILGDAPALQVNASLILGDSSEYCSFLLQALKEKTLVQVAELPEVKSRYQQVRDQMRRGLNLFANAAHLAPGELIVFDVQASSDSMISRYAPFYFHPDARYSIGATRDERGARITAMRNPWRAFPSVPLGALFERYGGGGHERVAAVILQNREPQEVTRILQELLQEIRRQDVALAHPA